MSLADYVRILGRGPGRSRSLTQDEAEAAMAVMLSGTAAPEAIGALLMLMRMKGETAAEIAGFARAAQTALPDLPPVDLDWPSYAAGRSRGAPWFLLSARLIADAGHRVLLHGWNGADTKVRRGLDAADIAIVQNANDIAQALDTTGIAYAPLEEFHPALFALLNLRQVLGLRSCVNTVCRMLNPANAPASVQGVFHPSYRLLQADAAMVLDWRALTVIKGGGGEFERNPAKDIEGFGLRDGRPWNGAFTALAQAHLRLSDVAPDTSLDVLWRDQSADPIAADIVIGTAAAALNTLGEIKPERRARALWDARLKKLAA